MLTAVAVTFEKYQMRFGLMFARYTDSQRVFRSSFCRTLL